MTEPGDQSRLIPFTLSTPSNSTPAQVPPIPSPSPSPPSTHRAPLLPTPQPVRQLAHSIQPNSPQVSTSPSNNYSDRPFAPNSQRRGFDSGFRAPIEINEDSFPRISTSNRSFNPPTRGAETVTIHSLEPNTPELTIRTEPFDTTRPYPSQTKKCLPGATIGDPNDRKDSPSITFESSPHDITGTITIPFVADHSSPSVKSITTPLGPLQRADIKGGTDASPTIRLSEPEVSTLKLSTSTKQVIQFLPSGGSDHTENGTQSATSLSAAAPSFVQQPPTLTTSNSFTHPPKLTFTPQSKTVTPFQPSHPSPLQTPQVQPSLPSTPEQSSQPSTRQKSDPSQLSDSQPLTSGPQPSSHHSTPHPLGSPRPKDDQSYPKKKLTPTSSTFVPRLDINISKAMQHMASLQVPLSQLFLLSRDFFRFFLDSKYSTKTLSLILKLEPFEDNRPAALWMDKDQILAILQAFTKTQTSAAISRPSIFGITPNNTLPLFLLSSELKSFLSHSTLTQPENLSRLDLLARLFSFAQIVNPDLVLCVTGSFPASLSLYTSDVDVVFVSRKQWRYIRRIQRIIRSIFELWYGSSFHPSDDLAQSSSSSQISPDTMIQTGLAYLGTKSLKTCPICGSLLFRHRCDCDPNLACAIEMKAQKADLPPNSDPQTNEMSSSIIKLLSLPLTPDLQKELVFSNPVMSTRDLVEYPPPLLDTIPSHIRGGIDRVGEAQRQAKPAPVLAQSNLGMNPLQSLNPPGQPVVMSESMFVAEQKIQPVALPTHGLIPVPLSPDSDSADDNTDSIAFGDETDRSSISTPPSQNNRNVPCAEPVPQLDPTPPLSESTTIRANLLELTTNQPLILPTAPSMDLGVIESTLTKLDLHLKPNIHTNFIRSARVPIIKLTQPPTSNPLAPGLKADISCGTLSGIVNTDYLRCILVVYPKAKPLIVALKAFLLRNELNEPYQGGLGGYSLCLMVISHLQQHKRNFNCDASTTPLGLLLIEFFGLYGECTNELKARGLLNPIVDEKTPETFHSRSYAISVRGQGQYIPLSELHLRAPTMNVGFDLSVDDRLVLEDPLDHTNNCTRSCYTWPTIKNTFRDTLTTMLDRFDEISRTNNLVERVLAAQTETDLIGVLTDLSILKDIVPSTVLEVRQRMLSFQPNHHFANPFTQLGVLARYQPSFYTNTSLLHPHFAGLSTEYSTPIGRRDSHSLDVHTPHFASTSSDHTLPGSIPRSSSTASYHTTTPNTLLSFLPSENTLQLQNSIEMSRLYREHQTTFIDDEFASQGQSYFSVDETSLPFRSPQVYKTQSPHTHQGQGTFIQTPAEHWKSVVPNDTSSTDDQLFDIWAQPAQPSFEPNSSINPIGRTRRPNRQPIALHTKNTLTKPDSALPSHLKQIIPSEAESYRPEPEVHQDALAKAVAYEAKQDQLDKKARKIVSSSHKVGDKDLDLNELREMITKTKRTHSTANSDEDEESSVTDEEPLDPKAPLSKWQLAKIKAKRQSRRMKQSNKRQKENQERIKAAKGKRIGKKLKPTDMSEEKVEKRRLKKESQKNKKPYKFGVHRIEDRPNDILLTSDVPHDVRTLAPSSRLFNDHVRSLEAKGLTVPYQRSTRQHARNVVEKKVDPIENFYKDRKIDE
ncbi:putative nucleolar protein 53 [Blattamonas nauphoetae]|uniref:Ribosome biogenesis protein NOP53 n=1 Tax=Blattamonas nauphoetae TaxID=2049346 RepID=A0ABQ9YG06_9EUKA|nr:putative nucleolar protein 53 [Blattamonas nauphoetae]